MWIARAVYIETAVRSFFLQTTFEGYLKSTMAKRRLKYVLVLYMCVCERDREREWEKERDVHKIKFDTIVKPPVTEIFKLYFCLSKS
jgi:hypothetical protein